MITVQLVRLPEHVVQQTSLSKIWQTWVLNANLHIIVSDIFITQHCLITKLISLYLFDRVDFKQWAIKKRNLAVDKLFQSSLLQHKKQTKGQTSCTLSLITGGWPDYST